MRIDLERVVPPDAEHAEERAWQVVARGYAGYEPRPPARTRGRLLAVALAAGVIVALVAVAVSPAGSGLVHSVRKAVGIRKAAPALTRLPTSGRLLVTSAEGPWIVQPDGSKRLLGAYAEAAWSPHGLFVAVTRRHELLAVDPRGTVRWSLGRSRPVRLPRWSPDGFRIAYLDGSTLRVVGGDGTGDRAFRRKVAPVAPAWRPSSTHAHVIAFVDAADSVQIADADSGALLGRRQLPPRPLTLLWTDDGQRLVAVARHAVALFGPRGGPRQTIQLRRQIVAAAIAPRSHRLALVLAGARTQTVTLDLDRPHAAATQVFGGPGTYEGIAWSPDARWLLLAWRSADQWLFVRTAGTQRIQAVSSIASQFSPGEAHGPFPVVDGWCCADGPGTGG